MRYPDGWRLILEVDMLMVILEIINCDGLPSISLVYTLARMVGS